MDNIEEISEEEFNKIGNFEISWEDGNQFPKIKEILPNNEAWNYGIIFTDGSIYKNGQIIRFKDYNEIFSYFNYPKEISNLQKIRKEFSFLEGFKFIPGKIIPVLMELNNSKPVYIKCDNAERKYYWKTDSPSYLENSDLLDALPVSIGDFDIFDKTNLWYIKIKDDDPFLYLAAENKIINKLLSIAPNYILDISGTDDFIVR